MKLYTKFIGICSVFTIILVSTATAKTSGIDTFLPPELQSLRNKPIPLPQNFAVPESPAFLLLGNRPTTVLRPSTIRELSVAASNFTGEGLTFVVPRSFAAEFSPILLLTKDADSVPKGWDLLRISIGTQRPDSNSSGTQLTFGIRFSTNTATDAISKEFNGEFDKIDSLMIKFVDSVVSVKPTQEGTKKVEIPPKLLDQYKEELIRTQEKWEQQKQREQNQNSTWSQNEIDFAVAFRFSATDSLLKSMRFDKALLWFTYARKFSSNAQNVIGINGGYENNISLDSANAILNIYDRFYAGSNYYKCFIEAQYSGRNGKLNTDTTDMWQYKLSLSLGGELKIFDGIWAEVSTGVSSNFVDKTAIISTFRLKYGI